MQAEQAEVRLHGQTLRAPDGSKIRIYDDEAALTDAGKADKALAVAHMGGSKQTVKEIYHGKAVFRPKLISPDTGRMKPVEGAAYRHIMAVDFWEGLMQDPFTQIDWITLYAPLALSEAVQ